MTTINTQEQRGRSSGDFTLLETDVYFMKITKEAIEEDKFAEPLDDGSLPLKLVLTWEVSRVTEEQDEEAIGNAVWQRFNPWYGITRQGAPSHFKAFIDSLLEQGLVKDFDPQAFDITTLHGIEQRVSVEKYAKTMGPNAGKPGNKVVSVLPLRRAKKTVESGKAPVSRPPTEEIELPF